MIYLFADCQLDSTQYVLLQAGQAAHLRPKAFQVLGYLIEHRDRVVDKQELCEAIWPDQFISDATLASTIRSVRHAVGDSGQEQLVIQTVHGRGYRFVAPLTQLDAHPEGELAQDGDGVTAVPAAPSHGALAEEDREPTSELTDSSLTEESWCCTACHHINRAEAPQVARFCVACGAPRLISCPQCHAEMQPHANFCATCGVPLSESSLDPVGPAPASSHIPPPNPIPSSDSSSSQPRVPGAERRQLTVMFCDLVDSTPLARQLVLEDLRDVVRAYQAVCADVIGQFDGYIAQYLGDGLLVYFGYPLAHEDDAQRAVRAGLGIIEALEALNMRLAQKHQVRLAVRLGIHTGLVIVDDIGDNDRREPLAIGETPNIASQIQSLATPNTVVISPHTARLVQGYFVCEAFGNRDLKGAETPMQLMRVLEVSGARSRLDLVSPGELTPMVDRTAETTLLLQHWAQVQEGMGHVIVLNGEAGIGKSRLAQVVKDQLKDEDYISLECRCSPYHENSAWYPLIDLCHRFLRWEPDEMPEARLQKLEGVLAQFALPLEETVPLLAALLSLPLPDGRYPPRGLTAQQERDETLEVMLSLVLELAAQRPVFFLVEDLHWADPSTLEFLTRLVEQVPTTHLCIVCACRPTFQVPWGNRSYLTEMTLSRLPQQYVEALVTGVTRGKPLPNEVLQQVMEKTDGVPLFVEELTKTLLEGELLHEVDGQYTLTAPLPVMSIPTTLHDSLMSRLDRLGTAKNVAQLGATLGRQFSYSLLHTIAPWDEAVLQQELGRLVESELVYQHGRASQTAYIFKHALVQETAYQSLARNTRQHYHQRIAEVLTETFPAMVETQPEMVAHHYTEAGMIEQAVSWWQRAGKYAIERSANAEAVHHLEKGLELLGTLPDTPERARQELEVQLTLTTPLKILRGHGAQDVERIYIRANELCQQVSETSQRFTALAGLRGVYTNQMAFRKALEVGNDLLQMAQMAQDPTLLLNAHGALGWNLFYLGDFISALEHLERGIANYNIQSPQSQPSETERLVMCLTYMSWVLWFLGYPEKALNRIREALTLAEQLAYPYTLGRALAYAAELHKWRREPELARKQTDDLIALSIEHGFNRWLAFGMIRRGWSLSVLGAAEEGLAQCREGLTIWQGVGGKIGRLYQLLLLAEIYGQSGQSRKGLDLLDEACAILPTSTERFYEAELYRLRGELLLHRCDRQTFAEAEANFLQALDVARHQQAKSLELRVVMSLTRLWQEKGKLVEARQILPTSYRWFSEGFDTLDLQEAKVLLDALP